MKRITLRKIPLLLICFLMASTLFGQRVSQNNEMRKSLDFTFEHIDKNSVPAGLLRDFAVEYGDLDLLSGKVPLEENNIGTLTAQHGGQSYSQMIMVGMPRFILVASHEPGGYKINAECIDTQFKDYLSNLNGVLKYNWGVKYPNREIRWLEADVPSLKIDLRGQNEKVVVFLEVIDALGNKSALQHIEINSQDVYVAENQNLYINAQGVLYKENKTKYLYNSARLYISYRANIPDKYKEREWMTTTAMVLKPFSVTSVIDARSGGPLIKNILPVEELDYIKNNSADNQVYRYTLILLNYKSRAIQFVPVTFTYVTNI